MTWLAWRQFRTQAGIAITALVAFAILLAATGPHLASMYATSGVAGCHGQDCERIASNFLGLVNGIYPVVYTLGIAGVAFVPAVIGIFWGAPLIAREFETGTFRLAWTQTITRTRWLAVKLALLGLAAMAVTEGLALLFGWWAAPIGQAARVADFPRFPLGMGPFSLPAFDTHGITPLGYAALAFTLGATTGFLLRRTVPAMALTLAIFAAIQIAMPLAIRPHLFPPAHSTVSIKNQFSGRQSISPGGSFALALNYIPSEPGAWILSSTAVNAAGRPVATMPEACLHQNDPLPCIAGHGIQVAVTYQPTSRYWPLQGTETAICLTLALALAGFCFWRLGRRLS